MGTDVSLNGETGVQAEDTRQLELEFNASSSFTISDAVLSGSNVSITPCRW